MKAAERRIVWVCWCVVVSPLLVLTPLSAAAAAASAPAAATTAAAAAAPTADFSRPLPLILALALLGIAPVLFMAVTAFVKISTVLQILKSALGTQSVPSATVVTALAAGLALVAMAPVGAKIWERGEPLWTGPERPSAELVRGSWDAVSVPMKAFWKANSTPQEQARFLALARQARPPEARAAVAADDALVLLPAFLVTELSEAFALGFSLYLPFLVLDLVVANLLLALGMQSMNPTQVSLPFKLLLFAALDGWGLVATSLVSGYGLG